MKLTIAAVTALTLSAASAAQDAAPSPPPPPAPPACTTDAAPYRDFDFWVGEWEVFGAQNGQKAGENVISKRGLGCVLLEEWTNVGGVTGTSLNFYDPVQGAWRQVWQSAGSYIDYTGGLDEDGAMVLNGTITSNATGQSAPFRGKWTPNDDGTVLQEFWQQDSEGNWTVWFSGEYRRKSAASESE